MTRTFLAADVDGAIRQGAAALTTSLPPLLAGPPSLCRWVKPDVMHATLRFFGDVDEERLAELVAIVPRLAADRSSIRVSVTRLDAFPGPRRARVLVLPLEDDGALAAIHDEIEAHAAGLGFGRETRAYRPHLTLGRFREPSDVQPLIAEVHPSFEGSVPSVTLYASKLGADGPTYTPLARRSFAADPLTRR